MSSYEALAGRYDALTADVHYEVWADYAEKHFRRAGLPVHPVLALACGTGSLTCRLAELTAQSEARLQSGESFFYADAPARVRRFFSPQRFYLTGDSLAVFFPMLSLAPAADGIPVFLLPRPDAAGEQNSQAS